MAIRLDDEARQFAAALADHTDVTPVDCVVAEASVTFVVAPDDMATVIGPDGRTVRELEDRFDRQVVLIEDADRPAAFVANALAPAAVYEVEVTDGTAIAHVDPADVGVAIGTDGARIERARRFADRHFDVEEIRIEERSPNDDT